MTNEDIISCKDITSLPEDLSDWLFNNYTKVEVNYSLPKEYADLKWEVACRKGNDWKYGRFYVCREKMLWRGPTFDEFYGGGIVD